mmetsp:Transcript_96875/g.271154  ORF Transcript_96875/g.271154 Transcript_96875/m.271154 type:complete len:233 (+) Transcript_96875:28-726(+)
MQLLPRWAHTSGPRSTPQSQRGLRLNSPRQALPHSNLCVELAALNDVTPSSKASRPQQMWGTTRSQSRFPNIVPSKCLSTPRTARRSRCKASRVWSCSSPSGPGAAPGQLERRPSCATPPPRNAAWPSTSAASGASPAARPAPRARESVAVGPGTSPGPRRASCAGSQSVWLRRARSRGGLSGACNRGRKMPIAVPRSSVPATAFARHSSFGEIPMGRQRRASARTPTASYH